MTEIEPLDGFSEQQQRALRSIRTSRIILPILVGLGVVGYLLWSQFNPEEFAKIQWTAHTFRWIAIAFGFLVLRHLSYSMRLYIISGRQFSYLKCIELLFIWEFSTAVSPTSVGGTAAALVVLTQERLPAAKTATIVLYKVLLDSIFFSITLPTLLLLFGKNMIHPSAQGSNAIHSSGYLLGITYVLMFAYGSLLFYGLFVSPAKIKNILIGFTRIGFLKKFRERASVLGDEIVIASSDIKHQNWRFHFAAFAATSVAWCSRFLLINCLIIAIIPTISMDFWTQVILFARVATMYIVTLFSPTPGGAGLAEAVFGGFLSDYAPAGVALIIAIIWRLMTYYSYLLAGVIVVPNWINNILAYRKEKEN